MDKRIVIIFGQPGAGKGTQSELLSDRLGLYPFETSKLLEEKFMEAEGLSEDSPERFVDLDGEKFDMLEEKKLWTEGVLCSPPFVSDLTRKKIKELSDSGKSLALSGSPRTLLEAEKLVPFLKELYGADNIKVVFLKISAESTIFRNSHRKICDLMRHPILYSEETANLENCPLDGSKLIKREGLDTPETIKVRLKEYAERTLPVLEFLKENGIQVSEIDGEKTIVEVFEDVLEALK